MQYAVRATYSIQYLIPINLVFLRCIITLTPSRIACALNPLFLKMSIYSKTNLHSKQRFHVLRIYVTKMQIPPEAFVRFYQDITYMLCWMRWITSSLNISPIGACLFAMCGIVLYGMRQPYPKHINPEAIKYTPYTKGPSQRSRYAILIFDIGKTTSWYLVECQG